MAAKFSFNKRPDNFAPFPVKFTAPDGTKVQIMATYKYRSKLEHAEYQAAVFEGIEDVELVDGLPDFSKLAQADIERTTNGLLDALVAWDVPDRKLDKDALTQLADECPAAIDALVVGYRLACSNGRLGN